MTTGSFVGPFQEVKARAVWTERDLKIAHKTAAVLDSHQKTLPDKVSPLTEKLPSVGIERANLPADLNEMAPMVQRMKEDIGKS